MTSESSSSEAEIGPETVLRHICEVCGKTEEITTQEAYQTGWDYPPGIGAFGIVSPRTCGDCGIDKTLYWRFIKGEVKSFEDLSDAEAELLTRIQNEPGSVLVEASE
jgi:hypothetical protein